MRYFVLLYICMFMIGEYVPQLDDSGNLLPMQCHGSTGYCWCAYAKSIRQFRANEGIICPAKN